MAIRKLAKVGVKAAVGVAKSYIGMSSTKKKTKSRKFSLNKSMNRLLQAKINGKIQREKVKVVNALR